MKKKILGVALIATIAVAAGWNFNQRENETQVSKLALVNVEALASCEKLIGTCWYTPWNDRCCDGGVNGCAPCD